MNASIRIWINRKFTLIGKMKMDNDKISTFPNWLSRKIPLQNGITSFRTLESRKSLGKVTVTKGGPKRLIMPSGVTDVEAGCGVVKKSQVERELFARREIMYSYIRRPREASPQISPAGTVTQKRTRMRYMCGCRRGICIFVSALLPIWMRTRRRQNDELGQFVFPGTPLDDNGKMMGFLPDIIDWNWKCGCTSSRINRFVSVSHCY